MVWLFAETATKYSKEMGLGGAGLGMEHFLYGNGEPLDITPLLEKIIKIEPERFVGKLVNAAITDKEDDYKRLSPEKDYQFTNRALKELKSTTGLNTALDAREWDMGWEEQFNAFGGARYVLHAQEADIVSQDGWGETVILEKGIDIAATDRYYWQLNNPVFLPSDVGQVAEKGAETLFDQFYKSHDVVEKTLRELKLPEDSVIKIMNIYSSDQRDEFTSNLAPSAYKLAEKIDQSLIGAPDLVENDLNLLKKIGAMEYDMTGHINISNRLKVVV